MSMRYPVRMETMGARLRRERERRVMRQADLARAAGVRVETVSRLERDAHQPEVVTVRKLAEALGVDPAWLRFGEEGTSRSEGA